VPLLFKTFPACEVWVSDQTWSKSDVQQFYRLLQTPPAWLTGVMYGPHTVYNISLTRNNLPSSLALCHYPGIDWEVFLTFCLCIDMIIWKFVLFSLNRMIRVIFLLFFYYYLFYVVFIIYFYYFSLILTVRFGASSEVRVSRRAMVCTLGLYAGTWVGESTTQSDASRLPQHATLHRRIRMILRFLFDYLILLLLLLFFFLLFWCFHSSALLLFLILGFYFAPSFDCFPSESCRIPMTRASLQMWIWCCGAT
jgi:hypothetical protein